MIDKEQNINSEKLSHPIVEKDSQWFYLPRETKVGEITMGLMDVRTYQLLGLAILSEATAALWATKTEDYLSEERNS